MKWGLLFLLVIYAALKSARVLMMGRRPGYRENDLAPWQRLRAGEPLLLILAMLISLPPAVAATWYHQHKFAAVLESATACNALISAYQQTPEIMHSNGEFAVYASANGYRASAVDAARQLGLSPTTIEKDLVTAVRSAETEQAQVGARVRQTRLVAVQSCLHPPPESANA